MAISKIDKVNIEPQSSTSEKLQIEREKRLSPASDRIDEKPQRNAKVDEVAKLYEKQFLREMVKAMRSSSDMGYMKPSMGEKIYREELDNQYVEAWGEQGGVGLQNIIYDQLMERYFSSKQINSFKSKEGVKLTDKDILHIQQIPKTTDAQSTQKSEMPLRVELKNQPNNGPVHIQLPWDAKLLSKTRLDDGKMQMSFLHENGFRSTFIFDGVFSSQLSPVEQQDSQKGQDSQYLLKQGQNIASLSPDTKSFFWNLSAPLQTEESRDVK